MYPDWFQIVLPLAVSFWLLVLSYRLWKQDKFLKSLFPSSGERDIRKKFEELLELERRLDRLALDSLANISKVDMVRFNPYQETGGDQSFSIALLNVEGSGLVITSLHSRSGTRVFAKPVERGKPTTHQLADEEQEAIRAALGSKKALEK